MLQIKILIEYESRAFATFFIPIENIYDAVSHPLKQCTSSKFAVTLSGRLANILNIDTDFEESKVVFIATSTAGDFFLSLFTLK